MNKSNLGWVVSGLLALALIGVLVFQFGSGGDRSASLLPGDGVALPAELSEEAERILDEKATEGRRALPKLPEGADFRRLAENPDHICEPNLPPNVFAEWRNNPATLAEAAGMADQIVVGTVEGVQDAPPLVAEAPGEPGGRVTTPVQSVVIRVQDAVKGPVQEGATITVERLGDAAGCYRVHGEPVYKTGEQYLLLLEEGLGGRQGLHTISPAGRFQVVRDRLRAVDEFPFVANVAGKSLDEILSQIRGN